MAKLLLKHEGLTLNSFELDKDEFYIGRKSNNDIQLDDPAVSSRHVRLIRQKNEYLEGHDDYFIEDMGSTNGTLVNEKEVTQQLLKHGDEIQIGNHHFRFDNEAHEVDPERTAIYLSDRD
ncbi:MAG: FHA domain-containing protein [Thioalkalispiraceae bacterium]|jgi:pSer/pThr/pTyr-binding forkhead associated (FHA) protein